MKHCLIMLPPAYAAARDFEQHGFTAAVARRPQLEAHAVFADVRFAEVTDGSACQRLRQQFILPARAQGLAVWLGGISLGAYVALGCAVREARELAGLCLLAPYLGSHIVTGEIARAGGLSHWNPPQPGGSDDERDVWRFLRDSQRPPLYLGLGREDRFLPRHRLLADALPPAEVNLVPGGHDWPTWRLLWENFLDDRLAQST